MLRFSLSADVFPPAYVGRMSLPISSITVSSCEYLLAGGPLALGSPPSGGGATIDPVAAATLVADGGGVPCDSAVSAAKDLGVSGLLGAIGVPGPELLDSIITSSSWITVTLLLMLEVRASICHKHIPTTLYNTREMVPVWQYTAREKFHSKLTNSFKFRASIRLKHRL